MAGFETTETPTRLGKFSDEDQEELRKINGEIAHWPSAEQIAYWKGYSRGLQYAFHRLTGETVEDWLGKAKSDNG